MNNKEFEVEFYPPGPSLSEAYQTIGHSFAFVTSPKDGSRQCCPFSVCRDFFHDAVRAAEQNSSCHIYGFSYNAEEDPPIDTSRTRVLVRIQENVANYKGVDGQSFKKKIKCGLKIVNLYERIAKTTQSKVYKVKEKDKNGLEKPGTFMFVGPGLWMESPFLVSMYTYLIRLGDKEFEFKKHKELIAEFTRVKTEYKEREQGDNDLKYLDECAIWMHRILKNRRKLLFEDGAKDPLWQSHYGIDEFHNYGGIHSLCKASTFDSKLNSRIEDFKKNFK